MWPSPPQVPWSGLAATTRQEKRTALPSPHQPYPLRLCPTTWCLSPEESMWWDGTVNPCENDYKSTLRMGDANTQGLSELWRSAAYERLREQHLAGRRSQRSPCNRCPVI